MTLKRKVQKISGSLHVSIPRDIATLLKIEKGDTVSIGLEGNRIILKKEV